MFATKILLKQATAATKNNINKNNKHPIQTLIHFLSIQGRLESIQKTQGFGHFLDLSWTNDSNNNVNVDRFSLVKDPASAYQQSSLIYRYRIPNSLRYLNDDDDNKTNSKIRLSTYTSILDEVSTWMMTLATFPNPRPGVSVSMGAEWGSFPRREQQQQRQYEDEGSEYYNNVNKKWSNIGFS